MSKKTALGLTDGHPEEDAGSDMPGATGRGRPYYDFTWCHRPRDHSARTHHRVRADRDATDNNSSDSHQSATTYYGRSFDLSPYAAFIAMYETSKTDGVGVNHRAVPDEPLEPDALPDLHVGVHLRPWKKI